MDTQNDFNSQLKRKNFSQNCLAIEKRWVKDPSSKYSSQNISKDKFLCTKNTSFAKA